MKQKLRPFFIFITFFSIVFAIGYFFAQKKSEPVYETKTDELIYDTENKAPKHILVLPEKKMHPRKAALARLAKQEQEQKEQQKQEKKPIKKKTPKDELVEMLANIPSVTKLSPIEGRVPLKILDALEESYEKNNKGFIIPKISKRGDKPWVVYGQNKQVVPNFYKVAVVLKNLGINPQATETTIEVVPSEVSFSFSPYAQNKDFLIRKARESGHETYIDLLLSSNDFLKSDTGPLAMDITVSEEELIERVHKALSGSSAIGGMIINPGMAGEDSRERLKKVLQEIKNRGLLIIDATNAGGIDAIEIPGLARKKADIVIERNYNSENLFKQLLEAEYIAKNNGQVLIVAEPKPIVIQALNEWIKTFSSQPINYEDSKSRNFDKPFTLVPVSNLVVE